MTKKEFDNLEIGDKIIHRNGVLSLMIDANFGDRKTAVTSVDITNPAEWILIAKASYKYVGEYNE